MQIPLQSGLEYEIPEDFLAELNALYYGVDTELHRMRLWCLANPERRKTSRGAKRFVFNWINKACQVRPKAAARAVQVSPPPAEPLATRLSHLANLKAAIK